MTYSDLGLTQEDFNYLMALSGIFFSLSVGFATVKLFIK